MRRDDLTSATERDAAGGRRRHAWRGVVLTVWALTGMSCVAQQADLVNMQTEFNAQIARLDQEKATLARTFEDAKAVLRKQRADMGKLQVAFGVRMTALTHTVEDATAVAQKLVQSHAQLNNEVRGLRDDGLVRLQGTLDGNAHRLDQLDGKAEALARHDVALEERLRQQGDELAGRIVSLGVNMDASLVKRNEAIREQFADFHTSLAQFKAAMTQVDTQLDREQARATTAETGMKDVFDNQLQATRQAMQTLQNYLATDVTKTIEDINAAQNTGNRILNDALNTHAARLNETRSTLETALTALRQTDSQHGTHLKEMTQSFAQLRDALQAMGDRLGVSLESRDKDGQQTTTRLNQFRQSIENALAQFKAQAQHVQELTLAVTGMREILDSLTGMVEANPAVRRLRQIVEANAGQLKTLTSSLARLNGLLREHDTLLMDLQNAPK